MALKYISSQGSLVIPGAYASVQVVSSPSGLATSGILMLVGEADQGPDFTLETNLSDNLFGPNSFGDVVAKYKSGPLVDAVRGAISPSSDTAITGAPSGFVLVKTNRSTKAYATLNKVGGGSYANLDDKSYGQLGNLIYYTVTDSVAEVQPTTGSFYFCPPPASKPCDFTLRVNGDTSQSASFIAGTLPSSFQTTVNALTGIDCTGGTDRNIISVAGTLTLVASGNTITLTRSVNWTNNPSVGDQLYIPSGSPIEGTGENCGNYRITNVTNTVITATKFANLDPSTSLTAPVNDSNAITATTNVQVFAPLVITLDAVTTVDGIGKSLEINEGNPQDGTHSSIKTLAFTAITVPAQVSWVSTSSSPYLLTSAAERIVSLNVNRQVDSVQETLVGGGDILLTVGYTGTTATVTVTSTAMNFTVSGGSGTNLLLTLADFPTISDLATYINSQTGYSAAPGNVAFGQLSPLMLDEVTSAGCCTTTGNKTLRLKADAADFFDAVSSSVLVQLNNPASQAVLGLPAGVASVTYLSGGSRGKTTNEYVTDALTALESIDGNFLVPLFSRNASLDITDGITDSQSDYTISFIHSSCKNHCIKMSTLKRRRNRQGVVSIQDTFLNSKNAAYTMAHYRMVMCFQNVNDVGASSIVTYQPWMNAVKAAALQAAGFYKAIFNKDVNVSGVSSIAGDFNYKNDDHLEAALEAGLMPMRLARSGSGFRYVSDQTTYSKDSNFVFNSFQAVYNADILSLTLAQRMEDAFVGQSLADVSASLALSVLNTIMADMFRLKLIASSNDAPLGYKNAVIKIQGPSMVVSLEAKLATALYFVPINIAISEITQTATT